MRGTLTRIGLTLLSLLLPGCKNFALPSPSSRSPAPGARGGESPALTPQQRQVKVLEDQIARQKEEQRVLQAKLDQVEANEKRLYSRLQDLQFDNRQQAEQLKHLSTLPAERDKYKNQVASLWDMVIKLRREVARLKMPPGAAEPTPVPPSQPRPPTPPAPPPEPAPPRP